MMRILGIADADSIHTIKWANYFASRGHVLHVVSFNPISAASAAAYHPTVALDSWLVPTLHLKRFWLTLGAIRRIRAIARWHRADVVHAHYLGYAAWQAALAGVHPLVVSVMGGGDMVGTAFHPRSLRERLLTPLTLRKSDLVLCWSANLAAIVKRVAADHRKVQVVIGGVDLSLFHRRPEAPQLRAELSIAPDDFVILSPRILRPLSNIDVIVDALALVRKELPNVQLLLVMYQAASYPEYARSIRRRVDSAGLGGAVRFVEDVPNSQMPLYYSASDCTVSIPATDGTPMTVMESLACSTPVVVLDLPDYDPELFVDGRTVVRLPRADPRTLADALLVLARDQRLARTLVQDAREIVSQRASYESEMRRLQDHYDRLPSAKRQSRTPRWSR